MDVRSRKTLPPPRGTDGPPRNGFSEAEAEGKKYDAASSRGDEAAAAQPRRAAPSREGGLPPAAVGGHRRRSAQDESNAEDRLHCRRAGRRRGNQMYCYDEETTYGYDDEDDDGRGKKRKALPAHPRSSSSSSPRSASSSSPLATHAVSNLLRRCAVELDRILLRIDNMSGATRFVLYFATFVVVFVSARILKTGSFYAALRLEKRRIALGGGWVQEKGTKSSKAAMAAVRGLSGKNVISYSLYGSEPKYTDGIMENVRLAPEIYGPEWTVRVYHDRTVPKSVISKLKAEHGVELVNMDRMMTKKKGWNTWQTSGDNTEPKMVWRFGVASDPRVNRYCVRDSDSRLNKREKAAVDEWIDSGLKFHIMRDHPAHSEHFISGGLWCGTKDAFPDMVTKLRERESDGRLDGQYMSDMNFLGEVVWPVAQQSVMQHDAFTCQNYDGESRGFPTKREGLEHVGAVIMNGRMREIDLNLLRDAVQPMECKDRGPNLGSESDLLQTDGGEDPEGEDGVWGGGWDLEEHKDHERDKRMAKSEAQKDGGAWSDWDELEGGGGDEEEGDERAEKPKAERGSTSSGSWWDWLFGGGGEDVGGDGGGDGDGTGSDAADGAAAAANDALQQQQPQEGPSEADPSKFCFKRAPLPKKAPDAPTDKGQVNSDTTFGSALERIAARPDVRKILEIGTWYGGGSTERFVDGLRDKSNCDIVEKMQCCESFVVTFEIHKPAWKHARVYHRDNPVWLVHGTTVGVENMLSEEEIPEPEKGEHYDLYYQRDKGLMAKEDPQLEKFCKIRPDVVLIDGNEYTGWGEFNVATAKCRPTFLALHDTGSLKTKKVEENIKENPGKFTLESKGEDKVGWAIYRVDYNEKPKKGSFRIVVLTSTKHKSLQRLLDSLNSARYDKGAAPLHLDIRIDHDDSYDHRKTVEVATGFDFDHGTKSVHRYNATQGRQTMWFDAWHPESEDERAVILEDALTVSPVWFEWLERAWREYGSRKDLGAISLCRQGLRASDGTVVKKETQEPFLYRVPGSHGFSPHAGQWRDFTAWIRSETDLINANVDVEGTITTKWHKEGLDTWEQYWVWWCWGSSSILSQPRSLYNLYVHPPQETGLVKHEADVVVKELAEPTVFGDDTPLFPKRLERFGWKYESEGKSDGSSWLEGMGW